MNLQLVVGTSEKYEPAKEIEEIQKKVDSLRAELQRYQNDVVTPKLAEIEGLVKDQNAKLQGQHKPEESK